MNNKIKVLIGDDSAETGVSVANKLREKGMYAYTRRRDCGIILESIKKEPPESGASLSGMKLRPCRNGKVFCFRRYLWNR